MTAALLDVVASELERRDVCATTDQVSALVQYLELLDRWARRINLTGQPRADWIAGRLLPDALVLVHELDPHPQNGAGTGPLAVMDVGSGNGVIGLVLALLRPAHDVLLVEPSQKRCTFLRTMVHRLHLSRVTIAEQRLETLQSPPRDLALSRATWAPETWLAHARSLVHPGCGQIGAFLGGQAPPLVPDLALERTIPYALNDGTERQLVLYRRR